MCMFKLKPYCTDYLWGGRRLKEEFGIESDLDPCAEAWVLSAYPNHSSVIADGPDAGMTFSAYLEREGMKVLGTNCSRFHDFPILTKFIDARDALSIQVHPDEEYAKEHEHAHGKTEMWYILDAEPDSFLYYGFEKEIDRKEFEERIQNNTLEDVLHRVPVKKGDVFFIEADTLHAIGKGILIAEIQQNSNVTYRIYDYGRTDKNGQTRELHTLKALDVTQREPVKVRTDIYPHIGECDFFVVDRLYIDGNRVQTLSGSAGTDTFVHFLITEGNGMITCGGDTMAFQKGDSIFLPAGSGGYAVAGCCEGLITYERSETL